MICAAAQADHENNSIYSTSAEVYQMWRGFPILRFKVPGLLGSFTTLFLSCFVQLQVGKLVNDLKDGQNLTRRVGNRASRMEIPHHT